MYQHCYIDYFVSTIYNVYAHTFEIDWYRNIVRTYYLLVLYDTHVLNYLLTYQFLWFDNNNKYIIFNLINKTSSSFIVYIFVTIHCFRTCVNI